jgi:hypothetical protein
LILFNLTDSFSQDKEEEEDDYNEADYLDEEKDLGERGEEGDEEGGGRLHKKRKRSAADFTTGEYPEEDGEYDPDGGLYEEGAGEEGEVGEEGGGGEVGENDSNFVEPSEDQRLEKTFEQEVLSQVKRDKAARYRKKRLKLGTEMDRAGM